MNRFARMDARTCVALGGVLAALAATYWTVGAGLVRQWATDDNYSHGFLVVPLALFFAWQRRDRLLRLDPAPDGRGLLLVGGGLLLLVAGIAGAELFLSRISIVPVVSGMVLFLLGRAHLRALTFPIAFLALMVPLPAIVFNQIAFPLQLIASSAGEVTLRAIGVPVLREGNMLELAALRLEVAEACSGIRSLVALLAVSLTCGQFGGYSTRRLWLLAVATAPVAVIANAARVAGTGVAAHYFGAAAAEGFLHTVSGALVFVVALAGLAALDRGIRLLPPMVRTMR
jgi:exosortase